MVPSPLPEKELRCCRPAGKKEGGEEEDGEEGRTDRRQSVKISNTRGKGQKIRSMCVTMS